MFIAFCDHAKQIVTHVNDDIIIILVKLSHEAMLHEVCLET